MVQAAFRPEFLNRLDEILLFARLSRVMTGIVDIQLAFGGLLESGYSTARVRRRRNGWPTWLRSGVRGTAVEAGHQRSLQIRSPS